MSTENTKESIFEKKALLKILQHRFESHPYRHEKVQWEEVASRISDRAEILIALHAMEHTGGEPDVIVGEDGEELLFIDCSKESPAGRRSVCYDQEALIGRKKYPPKNSAMRMAEEMGIDILTEAEYRFLQTIEAVDLKSSSWVQTPSSIRTLGGALFCDRRYDTVFTYHNGADSYYGARGFRGKITI